MADMPQLEEIMETETKMVVLTMSLPKGVWWALEEAEKSSGTSISEFMSKTLASALMLATASVIVGNLLDKDEKTKH